MNNAYGIMLREGALNDDMMYIADNGYRFGSHNSWKVLVEYYTYCNEWCNRKHQFCAKNVENALKRYQKICGKLDKEELEQIEDALDCLIF